MPVSMDADVINKARMLRAEVSALVVEWDPEFKGCKIEHDDDRKIVCRKLAKLLDCQTPDFMFWTRNTSDKNRLLGVEQHVLEGLRKLTGPHGRTLYKMLVVQTFGEK